MAHFYAETTAGATFAAHGGVDAGFVPVAWKIKLTDKDHVVSYSFDGSTVHGKVGPATVELPHGETIVGGRSRIYIATAIGGETVRVEAWD
jgi:hypothetical protein